MIRIRERSAKEDCVAGKTYFELAGDRSDELELSALEVLSDRYGRKASQKIEEILFSLCAFLDSQFPNGSRCAIYLATVYASRVMGAHVIETMQANTGGRRDSHPRAKRRRKR